MLRLEQSLQCNVLINHWNLELSNRDAMMIEKKM